MAALLGQLANPAMLGNLVEKAGSMNLGDLASKGADFAANMTPEQTAAAKGALGGLLTSGIGSQAAGLLQSGKAPSAMDLMGLAKTAASGAAAGMGSAGPPGGAGTFDAMMGASGAENPLAAALANKASGWLANKLSGSSQPAPAAAATPAAVQAAPVAAAVPVASPVATAGSSVAMSGDPITETQARAAAILHKDLGLPPKAAIAAAQGTPTPGLFETIGAAVGAGRKKRKTYRKKKAAKRAARKTGRKLRGQAL